MAEIGIDLDKWAAHVLWIFQNNTSSAGDSKNISFDFRVTYLGTSWDLKDDTYFYTQFLRSPEKEKFHQ